MIIIVARYNEDVAWTKVFKNVLIFNKGEKLGDEYRQIMMENVGREGHTFFKYISDNYDDLKDHTVFLQGNPFDHSQHLIQNLLGIQFLIDCLCFNIRFGYLSQHIIRSTLEQQILEYRECTGIHNTYDRIFNTSLLTDGKETHECVFGTGAQFIVSKECILSRPKSFYKNIVKMLEYSIDPIEGYHMERFYKSIFV
jgi:hypothetical protein